jgi:hypothetical protein
MEKYGIYFSCTINVYVSLGIFEKLNESKRAHSNSFHRLHFSEDDKILKQHRVSFSFVTNTTIKVRIIAGDICYHALGHLVKKKSLGLGLHKTIIKTNGAQSWALTDKLEKP